MTKQITTGIIAVAMIAIIGWYFYQNRPAQDLSPSIAGGEVVPLGSETVNVDLASSTGTNARNISKKPSVERAIPGNTINLDASYRERIISDLNKTIAALKKDESSYQDWIYLGLYWKILGDFEGAKEVWNYATTLAPSEEVAYINLANLYDLSLKNYAQAEIYYKKGLAMNPANTDTYRNLHEMYRYRYKQTTNEAENALKSGIERNPEALDLYVMLARFYAETGRAAEARAEYDLAIALAKKQGNASIAAELEKEKGSIK
ncbi:MAG TPA: tetratricopeptide repeat protein [Candidatus Paceibacterota bacterium]